LLLSLGAIWVITQLLGNLPSGTGSAFAWVTLATAAMAMAYPLVRLSRRAGARQALLRKAKDACDAQLASLIRRRAQLVQPDAYGKPQIDKWEKEIDYFISRHIRPLLTPGEQAVLERHYYAVAEILNIRVEASLRSQPASRTFSDDMTPAEFEAFVRRNCVAAAGMLA
jgi:hypothetical protein